MGTKKLSKAELAASYPDIDWPADLGEVTRKDMDLMVTDFEAIDSSAKVADVIDVVGNVAAVDVIGGQISSYNKRQGVKLAALKKSGVIKGKKKVRYNDEPKVKKGK